MLRLNALSIKKRTKLMIILSLLKKKTKRKTNKSKSPFIFIFYRIDETESVAFKSRVNDPMEEAKMMRENITLIENLAKEINYQRSMVQPRKVIAMLEGLK
jgi:hypothetical protein